MSKYERHQGVRERARRVRLGLDRCYVWRVPTDAVREHRARVLVAKRAAALRGA